MVESNAFFGSLVYISEGSIPSHTMLFCCDDRSRPRQYVLVHSFASFRFLEVELCDLEHIKFRMQSLSDILVVWQPSLSWSISTYQ